MLNYIPGIIHETFQNKHYYEVENDFIAIVCNDIRFSELFNNYDTQTSDLELVKGYVLSVRYFKHKVDATVTEIFNIFIQTTDHIGHFAHVFGGITGFIFILFNRINEKKIVNL